MNPDQVIHNNVYDCVSSIQHTVTNAEILHKVEKDKIFPTYLKSNCTKEIVQQASLFSELLCDCSDMEDKQNVIDDIVRWCPSFPVSMSLFLYETELEHSEYWKELRDLLVCEKQKDQEQSESIRADQLLTLLITRQYVTDLQSAEMLKRCI